MKAFPSMKLQRNLGATRKTTRHVAPFPADLAPAFSPFAGPVNVDEPYYPVEPAGGLNDRLFNTLDQMAAVARTIAVGRLRYQELMR